MLCQQSLLLCPTSIFINHWLNFLSPTNIPYNKLNLKNAINNYTNYTFYKLNLENMLNHHFCCMLLHFHPALHSFADMHGVDH